MNIVPLKKKNLLEDFGSLLFESEEPVNVERLAILSRITEQETISILKQIEVVLLSVGLITEWAGGCVRVTSGPSQDFIKLYREGNKDNLAEVVNDFIRAKQLDGRRDLTLKGYSQQLIKFVLEIGKLVENIQVKDIRKYLMTQNEGNAKATIANKVAVLRSFFNWLEREELISKNPMNKIDTPRTDAKSQMRLTHEQVEQIREVAKGIDEVLFETLYSSGIRVSEAVGLDWNDLDLEKGVLVVRDGKGGKDRTTFLSTKACRRLRQYKSERKDVGEYVFRSNYRRRMSKETIERRIKNLGESANIKKVTPHTLRRTFATHLLSKGMEIEKVQILLGHEDIKTTQIYAETDLADAEYSYRKFME